MKRTLLIIGILFMSTNIKANEIVISADNIEWGLLNPARGEASPKAFDLWGDRTKNEATGMLVKFEPGFASPPHIHNITYKGIVIEGLVHNDNTTAPKNWMPETSYWLQPAGQEHITAADDLYNMAYIEIDSGPYLVEPVEESFNNGETAVNARAENFNWIDLKNNLKVINLWGANARGTPHGYMLKIPDNFSGTIKAEAQNFHLVVIKGEFKYKEGFLPKASYIGNSGKFEIDFSTTAESVIYIRTNGKVRVASY